MDQKVNIRENRKDFELIDKKDYCQKLCDATKAEN